ncbi:hypothetical protein [Planktotalea sp.]|uniref:hypothetical protein n=1 Tax=Planktotalea sp. TaxID=2029877 RepID=UPI0035C7BDE0
MTYAHRLCEKDSLDFSDLFAYQYLVSPCKKPIDGFDPLPFGKFLVHVGKKLRRAVVTDVKGRFFGYVLGIGVDKTGVIQGVWQLDCLDLDDPRVFDKFAEYLEDVSGRYVFVCAAGIEQRIYTDSVAMIGAVYNPLTKRVGSALNLVLDDDPVLHPSYDHSANEKRGGKYTLFHTRDAIARRINGSFYLDLYNMLETRFWPRTEQFEVPREQYGAVYDEIAATARHSIASITKMFKTSLPLSGGRDSRLIVGFA